MRLIISLLLPLLAGFIGSAFTTPNIASWYQYLTKPFFSPPNWLFAPVWTLLYLLMGYAFYLIWQKKKSLSHSSFFWYWSQLLLNTLWSILFFGLQNPLLAFIEIIILWFFIFKTVVTFSKINKTAGLLLYPYLAWVSFASLLNFAIYWLNR